MEKRGMHIGFWWESQKERDVGGRIKMDMGWYGLDLSGSG
jgi:hypothetical protein